MNVIWRLLENFHLVLLLMVISYFIFKIITRGYDFIKHDIVSRITHKIIFDNIKLISNLFYGLETEITEHPDFDAKEVLVSFSDDKMELLCKNFSLRFAFADIKSALINIVPDAIFYDNIHSLLEHLNELGIIKSLFYMHKIESQMSYFAGKFIMLWLLEEKAVTIENGKEVKFHGERIAFSTESAEKLSRMDKSSEREDGVQTSEAKANGRADNNSYQNSQERN